MHIQEAVVRTAAGLRGRFRALAVRARSQCSVPQRKRANPRSVLIRLAGLAVAAGLAACGGGGEGGGSATNASTSTVSQGMARNLAKLGFLVQYFSGGSTAPALMGAWIELRKLSTYSGPSTVMAMACVSGSGTATLAKSVVTGGLIVGDEVSLNYDRCVTSTGHEFHGVAKLTLATNLSDGSASNYAHRFRADMSSFSVTRGKAGARMSGVADVRMQVKNGLEMEVSLAVPAARMLMNQVNGMYGGPLLGYSAGATFLWTDSTAASGKASYTLDGNVTFMAGGASASLSISTPSSLSGAPTAVGGTFMPTAGSFVAVVDSPSVSVSASFQGGNVHVLADTNADGRPEWVFDMPAAELMQE